MRSACVASSHKGGQDTQMRITSLIMGVAILVVRIVEDVIYIIGVALAFVYLHSEAQLLRVHTGSDTS